MKPSELLTFTRPLWKHQADALDRFAYENEAALLHEMGTGKTTSAIAWLRAKYNVAKEILPTLIVSPVATLYNWQNEFEANAPIKVASSVVVLTGGVAKRIKQLQDSEARIFITNPEAFDKEDFAKAVREKLFKVNVKEQIVIVDEAHRFKNPKSKRLGHLLFVTDFVKHRMILTGTPILNSYLDIWAQWRILDRGQTFGMNFYSNFRERYFVDANLAWKGRPKYFPHYVPREGIDVEISKLMERKASRLTKAECLTLPPLVRVKEHVPLSKEQAEAYQQMEQELIAQVSSGECVAQNALTRVLRMLQILSGYVQVDTDDWDGKHTIKNNPRLERLSELLEELAPKHKVIVWCVFQENYKVIKRLCEELGVKTAELTGETKDRQAEIDRFNNDPDCRVMISNPQAGGVGVNLTAASYAIYYSRSYSLGDRLQSEARNHRGGSEQHEKITLIDLVAQGTLDEDVLSALERKENFADSVLDRLKNRS